MNQLASYNQTPAEVEICLISPGLPSSNPRLVKEAQALTRAGYRVHCVVGDYATPLRDYDSELIREAGATMTRVGLGSLVSYRARRSLQIASSRFAEQLGTDLLLAWASSPQTMRLYAAARDVRAKLYIGHTLAALAASVLAAESRGGLAGFDAEDCHFLETSSAVINGIAGAVERKFLRRCAHKTASSPQIADAYRQQYGVEMTTVLNCFDAPSGFVAASHRFAESRPLSLYWFSQTVGPGRGLEQLVLGAARANTPVQLCFRGIVSDEYRKMLRQIGRDAGVVIDVTFLPPEHPDRMIPAAAEHDIGLSLELREPRNRDLCLTNKLFTYLAAGIPQIVSRTAAQAELARELGEAAILIDLDKPDEIAAAIDKLAGDRANYVIASSAALRLHRDRFSWAAESPRLLEAVGQVFSKVDTCAGAAGCDDNRGTFVTSRSSGLKQVTKS